METRQNITLGWLLFGVASALLALHPVLWLVQTWRDPAYGSNGYAFVILSMALFLYSVSSGPAPTGHDPRLAVKLLLMAAVLRFLSQILAVNFIGGLALCIDVYALFRLARPDQRPRPVSPFWLASLIVLSLPVERLLQRFAGLILQDLSAHGSCLTLGIFFDDLVCAGTLLVLRGHKVLVDLPCSGTTSLLVMTACLVAIFAVGRPRPLTAVFWVLLSATLSVLCNSIRVTVLTLGAAYRDVLPFDVMADPAHGIIGLVTLGLSLLPLFIWFRPSPRAVTPLCQPPTPSRLAGPSAVTGGIAFCLALAILASPRTAWDISEPVVQQSLPTGLLGQSRQDHMLSPAEQRYFTQYGGAAQKASYGPIGLTLVRTTSPLRHLHAPDECLRGLGFEVSFTGTRRTGWPSAIFAAKSDQNTWRVDVTYAANDGFVTANISAAMWHWMTHPGTVWSSYQRITPAALPADQRHQFDSALMAALDVPQKIHSNIGEDT